MLTVAALDVLYAQPEGCCPLCCGMCWVLEDMKKRDDLDAIVRKAPLHMYMDSAWWDAKNSHVNLAWLTSKWVDYECPNHTVDEPAPSEDEELVAE